MTSDTEHAVPTIADAFLAKFQASNPHVQIRSTGEAIVIEKPWGAEDTIILCDLDDQLFFKELNEITLNPVFDAIFHSETNEAEFIFAFLDPEESYCDREFTMHFDGNAIDCSFREPSDRFMSLALRTMNVLSDARAQTVRQIRMFRDYQRLDEISERATKYFEGKVPRNFFVKLPSPDIDLVKFSYHMNFIHSYYDRHAPEIVVREESKPGLIEASNSPVRFINTEFPKQFSIGLMDEIILQLIRVARASSSRQAYIYYYQVIEYSGHYFVDDKAKTQIKKMLRDPAVIDCDDNKIGELFSLLIDVNHNDDVKMRRMIEETVNPEIIWTEIENDIEFFSSPVTFEGGFVLAPLVSGDTTATAWKTMWMPKLFDQLTKIRNCLVHARERRENKVILPTDSNNNLIGRYIPIIERVARQISLATPNR